HTRWPRDWSSDVCSSDLSPGDLALWMSSLWKTKRLGSQPEIPEGGVDLIDASFLRTNVMGHDYHIGCAEMHEDIRGLLDGHPARSEERRVGKGGVLEDGI